MDIHTYQDMLTGISNRRFFVESLEHRRQRCVEYGDNCAILFLEIEDLKAINAGFGRTVGDALLTRVARILKHNVRETDVLARISGDEFGLLFDHLNSDQIEDKIDILFAQLDAEKIVHASQNIPLKVSIAYCCMGPQDTTDGLMSRAEFTKCQPKGSAASRPG